MTRPGCYQPKATIVGCDLNPLGKRAFPRRTEILRLRLILRLDLETHSTGYDVREFRASDLEAKACPAAEAGHGAIGSRTGLTTSPPFRLSHSTGSASAACSTGPGRSLLLSGRILTTLQRVSYYLLAVLALATAVSCRPPELRVSENFERSFTLGDSGTVAVNNENGSLRFIGVDGEEVRLRATKRATSSGKLERIQIEIEESPEGISVETAIPWWVGNASVSYELEVPRKAAVQANTVNGSIRLSGTSGESHAKTVNGSVKIADFGGDLTAETVNGSVRVAWSSLEGSSQNSLKTVNGLVEARFPSDASGGFKAKTVNGSIKTDLPLRVHKGRFWRRPSINDRIGEGGAEFQFSTVNGSVRILSD